MSFENANRPQPIDQKTEILQRVQKVFISLLLFVGLNLSVAYVMGAEHEELPVVYHVYDEDEYVGELADIAILNEIIASKLDEAYEQFNSDDHMLGNQLSIVPEHVFRTRPEDEETIEVLKEKLFIQTEATIITIDGQLALYVKDEDTYDELIRRLKLQLVSEQDLMRLEASDYIMTTPQIVNNGEERVIDIVMNNRLETMTGVVRPEEVVTLEEALNFFNEEQLVEMEVHYELERTETIPFTKKVIKDPTLYIDDIKIIQEGVVGKKIVTELIRQQEDEVIDKFIKKEDIVVQPHIEVAIVGTKESPSRGTGTFMWPADGGYVSSHMGERWGSYHRGIDIARPTTRAVYAADNGVVTSAESHATYGNKVVINHNNGYETLYAHLASIDVTVGQTVGQGTTIGEMGSTGRSTGIHLHFEVTNYGELVNPLSMVGE